MARKQGAASTASHLRSVSLWQLAAATGLIVAGLFCVWQAWLIADESSVLARVQAARQQAVAALTAEVASQRQAVAAAVAAPALSGDASAWQGELRHRLPQAIRIDIYDANLDQVLHADYRQFGYAKAAQLLSAWSGAGIAPLQTISNAGDRRLSVVAPLGDPTHPQAWAWIELPFAPLQQRFEAIPIAAGRLQLRQGEQIGDLVLLSRGSTSTEEESAGVPVPGSTLVVSATRPLAFVALPRSLPLAIFLALAGLIGGAYLLWLRAQPRRRVVTQTEDVLLSDLIKQAATPVKPAPSIPPPAPTAAPPTLAVDPSIFRAYDVRGVVGTSLTAEVAFALGQSIGSVMREKGLGEIVVGRDGRLSGPELAGALSDGLREAGIDVIDLGAVPTPVVYYAAFKFETGSGVAVTGSHNPPDYNGFKIVVGGETLAESAIQDLYRRIASGELARGGKGRLRQVEVGADYLERIVSDVQMERPFKVVVDCGNGIPGILAPQVLEGIGAQVIPLYCEVDGNFPNHHPDPSDLHNLKDLILAVKQTGADLGIAFDGDGDRLGVVTRQGEVIFPDRLLMLFARDVLSRQPGATIIYDVKCTGHMKSQVLEAGGSPLMWRTGHSLIKAKMRETAAELAGEMSGHFFFKERWYGFDDGIYAGARLLEILAGDAAQRTPEEVFATLPQGVSTPELKIEMAEGAHYAFIERFRAQASFGEAALTTIDGVRADWADGWGLVRPSNTTPILVLRFDADNAAALRRIQNVFREQLLAIEPGLKLPF
jgi:phosphomannomutase/phosphoglucomutase